MGDKRGHDSVCFVFVGLSGRSPLVPASTAAFWKTPNSWVPERSNLTTSHLRQSSTSENTGHNLNLKNSISLPQSSKYWIGYLVLHPSYLLVPLNVFSPDIISFSPSLRLTSLEEELMDLARTMGSQQTSLEQLELELEAEQEGVKKGQRWADRWPEPESVMLWWYVIIKYHQICLL